MYSDLDTHTLIIQLKNAKERRGLSCPQIYALVNSNGLYVSLSTIKRVFAPGSEDMNFRYDESLKPIAAVLVGGDELEKPIEDAPPRSRFWDIAADQVIDRLDAQFEQASVTIEHLHQQLSDKDKQIQRYERRVVCLVLAVMLLLVLIIAGLAIDKIDPSLGYFWRTQTSPAPTLTYNTAPRSPVYLLAIKI